MHFDERTTEFSAEHHTKEYITYASHTGIHVFISRQVI